MKLVLNILTTIVTYTYIKSLIMNMMAKQRQISENVFSTEPFELYIYLF